MPTEEQYQQRIEALEARVAELTRQLEVVTRERDDARGGQASTAPASSGSRIDGPSEDVPRPGSLCSFCDGEGVYWVHDFEMVCRRCNGTGRVPKSTAGSEVDHPSI